MWRPFHLSFGWLPNVTGAPLVPDPGFLQFEAAEQRVGTWPRIARNWEAELWGQLGENSPQQGQETAFWKEVGQGSLR